MLLCEFIRYCTYCWSTCMYFKSSKYAANDEIIILVLIRCSNEGSGHLPYPDRNNVILFIAWHAILYYFDWKACICDFLREQYLIDHPNFNVFIGFPQLHWFFSNIIILYGIYAKHNKNYLLFGRSLPNT